MFCALSTSLGPSAGTAAGEALRKLFEEHINIVRTGTRFRMPLEAECGLSNELKALQTAIKEGAVRGTGIGRQCIGIHRKPWF